MSSLEEQHQRHRKQAFGVLLGDVLFVDGLSETISNKEFFLWLLVAKACLSFSIVIDSITMVSLPYVVVALCSLLVSQSGAFLGKD